jgi:hypothetical protein
LTAARSRATKATDSLVAGLKKVGTSYRITRDARGEVVSVYWSDAAGKVQMIRPVPPGTVVPSK